jgi:hypothetical protein
MMTTRIDQYICLDVDKIIVDEMQEIVDGDCGSVMQEDLHDWIELQQAAQVILKYYTVPGQD